MPIEAVKIPQNVYVEDRIIGPVTLKQLTITGIGAGLGYMCYGLALKSGVDNIVLLALAWFPAVIAAAFAFLKVNDLSLLNIIFLFIESLNKPQERYWSPHPGLSINLITGQSAKDLSPSKKEAQANRLAEVTRQLEKRQEELNHLARHNEPNPNALEPVKTQLAEEEKKSAAMSVNPDRVQADGLDPAKSVDTIATAIGRFPVSHA